MLSLIIDLMLYEWLAFVGLILLALLATFVVNCFRPKVPRAALRVMSYKDAEKRR